MGRQMDKHQHTTLEVRPDFVIIGAMKCATSTIHDQLAHQPGISMSEPKEPNFFSDDAHWRMGISWYESLFASMPSADLKGESSTHYTKLPTYPQCAKRVREWVPDAKLIYVMRDPVDRIVSQYIHEWSVHVIAKDCSIDQAIREHPMLVDYSRYAMQIEPYIKLFGRESILPVFFERMMREPQAELERIARHIGYAGDVHWHDDEAKNVSSQRQRRSPVLNKMLDVRLIQMARRTLMPESIRSKIRSRWTMDQRPQLADDSLAHLHEQLDPDLARLGKHLGMELSCQGFKEQVVAGDAPRWSTATGVEHG